MLTGGCNTCCLAFFCPCVVFGQNMGTLSSKEYVRWRGTDRDFGPPCHPICPSIGWHIHAVLRKKRNQNEIRTLMESLFRFYLLVSLWLLHTDPGDEIFLIILQSISQMIGISKNPLRKLGGPHRPVTAGCRRCTDGLF